MSLPVCAPAPEPATEETSNIEADTKAVEEKIENWDEAFNKGDVDGLASFYTTDAVRMEPDKPAWAGKQAIKLGFEEMFRQYAAAEIHVETINTAEDLVFSGDWSIARISWKGTMTPSGAGEPIQVSGKAMSVSQRQPDGTWKTVWDIWNSDAPLPEEPTS